LRSCNWGCGIHSWQCLKWNCRYCTICKSIQTWQYWAPSLLSRNSTTHPLIDLPSYFLSVSNWLTQHRNISFLSTTDIRMAFSRISLLSISHWNCGRYLSNRLNKTLSQRYLVLRRGTYRWKVQVTTSIFDIKWWIGM
jgi:hypothetical protein